MWLIAIIHIRGVGPGRVVSNALTILKVAALLGFIAVGLAMSGSAAAPPARRPRAPSSVTGWLLGLIVVMFVYSGWNAAAYMAEEVRDPGRNLPLALALGTGAVTLIYILINVLYLKVIPIQELVTLKGSVLDVAAERLIGVRAGDVMGIVSIISLAASVNAMTFAGPRVYFAMARDGVFLPAAARIHPTYKTPWIAIVGQAAWATVLILTGSLDALGNYVGVRDHAVRRDGGRRGVRAAGARAARAAAVQGDRLSADAGDLRALQRRHGGQRASTASRASRACGLAARSAGEASRVYFVVHEAREGTALSASSVSSASAPSLAANSRNDRGEPRKK